MEIGVNNGKCFLRIRGRNKIAVDPAFKIPLDRKLKYLIKNPTNVGNKYFELTSDDFFLNHTSFLSENRPEVVFVDGLHTYKQALKDVLNSLAVLEEGGLVLMHDCNPLTEAAGFPAESIDDARKTVHGYEGVWNGDVWKTIVHLRSLHPELEVFVLDCDHGIGFVRKKPSVSALNYTVQQIESLTYKDFDLKRKELLDLKPEEFFFEFLKSV